VGFECRMPFGKNVGSTKDMQGYRMAGQLERRFKNLKKRVTLLTIRRKTRQVILLLFCVFLKRIGERGEDGSERKYFGR